jgi:diguanylate cyclase (GGDEF)-like protein
MQSLLLSQLVSADFLQPALSGEWEFPAASPEPAPASLLLQRALAKAEDIIRKQAEHIRHLENLALLDELTGLHNRRGFFMAFQRELAIAQRDASANGAILMVDLDRFKLINDTYGHGVGDAYLHAAAQALTGCVRSSDIVARLGGDEFAILFPRMSKTDGMKRLVTLEKDFNSRILQVGSTSLPLRASFGLSVYTGVDEPETVMASADLKLYAHKASRRNRA